MGLLAGAIITPIAFWAYRKWEREDLAPSGVSQAPGDQMSIKTQSLDAGAAMTQTFDPIKQIHAHLCGIHSYSGDPSRQVEAEHYCAHLNEDFRQCLIYDTDTKNARLIGVEYVISAKLFEGLDEEEKKYWHSHSYEVKSGVLSAPGIPMLMEHKLMENLEPTYGKTFHFWQVDKGDPLPLGPPQLMMSCSPEAPPREDMILQRDQKHNLSTAVMRRDRDDIPATPPQKGADHWKSGRAYQITLTEKKVGK